MTSNSETLQQEMAALRLQYHENLSGEISELLHHSTLPELENLEQRVLTQLRDTAHRLAGSALTFGYEQIGLALRALEGTLDNTLAGQMRSAERIRKALEQVHNSAMALDLPAAPGQHNGVEAVTEDDGAARRPEDLHLYVLEDDPSTSDMLKLGLSSFGYRVTTFVDINLLTAAALADHPDGLIIDTEYSSFSDQNLAAAANAMQENGMDSIPILVVSENSGFLEKLHAARHGVVAFLNRPISIPALESSLEGVMQHQTRSPYRVLLIDDDVFSMERHRIMLETWGIVARCVSNPVDVMTVIDEFKPDLLMIDLNMPLCSGIELAKVIRFHKQWIHIPIIFLSGELDANRQMTALKTGGDEFITKPVVERPFVSMILMRAKRARQLAELMIRDSLTGLLKHTEIKDRLCHELARARRNKTTVSVAMLDIDKFKRINDTYGHPVGDTVIATLAHLLRRALRTTDIVGRYGGEEYMVVMPDSDVANAIRKLDLLRREFEAIGFHHKDLEFHCSFSGGVSDSDSSDKIDLLIEKADMALYRAKTQGRNQILGAMPE